MLCDTRKKIVRAGRGGARERAAPAQAPAQPGRGRARRGDSGETLALLVVWPALLVAILVLLVHAFIVTNAQAEAEVAASAGLRAAWRSAANEDFLSAVDSGGSYVIPHMPYDGDDPHPKVRDMAGAAQYAVARAAATEEGWRWWTPGAAEVQSNWCHPFVNPELDQPPQRPSHGNPGWVRVVVSGEVFGPLAALWPDRLDRVYAAATGPAVVTAGQLDEAAIRQVPAELPVC